jgi:hypothetical protein
MFCKAAIRTRQNLPSSLHSQTCDRRGQCSVLVPPTGGWGGDSAKSGVQITKTGDVGDIEDGEMPREVGRAANLGFTADRACAGAGGWRPQGVIESYLGLSHDGLGLLGVVHRGGLCPQAGDAGPLVAELEA